MVTYHPRRGSRLHRILKLCCGRVSLVVVFELCVLEREKGRARSPRQKSKANYVDREALNLFPLLGVSR